MNNIAAFTYKTTFFGGLGIQVGLGGAGSFGHGAPPSRQWIVKGGVFSCYLLYSSNKKIDTRCSLNLLNHNLVAPNSYVGDNQPELSSYYKKILVITGISKFSLYLKIIITSIYMYTKTVFVSLSGQWLENFLILRLSAILDE